MMRTEYVVVWTHFGYGKLKAVNCAESSSKLTFYYEYKLNISEGTLAVSGYNASFQEAIEQ